MVQTLTIGKQNKTQLDAEDDPLRSVQKIKT